MLTVPVLPRLPLKFDPAVPAFQVPLLANVEAALEPDTFTLPFSVPLLVMLNVPLVPPNTALVTPVTVELLVIPMLPEVEKAWMALDPVELRATPLVIVIEPSIEVVEIALPVVLPTVPPVSETTTLPLPFAAAAMPLSVPLSAPPVWLMSMEPLPF